MADDGKASVYLRKKDAYDGLMTFTFQLSNGNVRRSEVKKDFSEVNVGDMWGFFNFCSPDDLLYAARATEGGVLELKVRLSAPKLNIASQVVNGYA
uniref:MATH domain-containing protein n=1 Tax=Chromera velia CCMP2878 TaxID=1169474 RepID=A0A0G4I6T3_9ALVE|eukprot:Cvel_36441.t1-p1 / transcript=Cvel_36441.t1 / gene=Cvel_36441 / organism=Chromera_velia_CCMP2878 / gene_product=hypothetical protein / transcript_product=hypothetical protein / location=Cvel_scaffold7256:1624-1908(-) / protein_length=95 / sequence_SO=supercontig / SO=protein_coding / is_pseudo=false